MVVYLLRGRLGVVGATLEAFGLRVVAATARTDAVFPFPLRAALICLGDSFTWEFSMGVPWIHLLRTRRAS
jgi:hypothetical protein